MKHKREKRKITDPSELVVNGVRQTQFTQKIKILGDKKLAESLGIDPAKVNINTVVRAYKNKHGIP